MNHLLTPNKIITGAKYESPEAAALAMVDCQVNILISRLQLVYMVSSLETRKVMMVQPYQFTKITSGDVWQQSIDSIFDADPWLTKTVAEKKTGIATNCFTLSPAAFDTDKARAALLKANCRIEENDHVISDKIASDIHLLYGLSPAMVERCAASPGNFIMHALSGFINHLLNTQQQAAGKNLFVNVRADAFQVVLISDGALEFCNSFVFHSPEDFIYHLLFCCTQLQLNPEQVSLTITGEVMRDSILFQMLNKYVRHVQFAKQHPAYVFGNDYPMPSHFFYNLFCL